MRIGVLSVWDARSQLSWSGTPYNMAQALRRHVGEVDSLGGFYPPTYRALDVSRYVWKSLTGRTYAFRHTTLMAKSWKRAVERRLRGRQYDVLFAPAASGLISMVETDIPIVYASDATFELMVDYNPRFSRLTSGSRRQGDELERLAIRRAVLATFPTEWAGDSAVHHYGADPARVRVIPWGANLDAPPAAEVAAARSGRETFRLLLVGADWRHKGADIAVEALRVLRSEGVAAELTVVGCTPPAPRSEPGLTIVPFLNKHDPAQVKRLNDVYLGADLFMLPTRNECYGIVFCEASAFGLPILATNTGGVPGAVREGVNGHLLPLDADGRAWASAAREILGNRERRDALAAGARREYDERLNWDAWGRAMAAAMRDAGLPVG